jgi:hypothetical protein
MGQYNHAFTVAFSVLSNNPKGEDVTPEMFKAALTKRMKDLDEHDEWEEAVGGPFDSYFDEDSPCV